MRALHAEGPLSRSELGERTGLTRSGIRRLVGDLVDAGLVVEERGESLGLPGRPSPLVHLAPTRAVVLALEIAVDSLAVAVVGLGGHVLDLVRVDRPRGHLTVEDIVADLAELAERRGAGVAHATRSSGSASPSSASSAVTTASCRRRRTSAGATCRSAHALAAAFGAAGADRGGQRGRPRRPGRAPPRAPRPAADDVVFLSGEVGLGGGLIVGGRPLTGIAGFGGEVGHMPVNPLSGTTCRCGSVGCWETEVGEQALLARAGRPVDGGRAAVDAVLADAAAGDATALAALAEVGRWLGIGLAGLVNMLNPARVVLGGHFATPPPVRRRDRRGRPRPARPRRAARARRDRAGAARRRRRGPRRRRAGVRAAPRRSGELVPWLGGAAPTGPLGHRQQGVHQTMSKLSRTHRGPHDQGGGTRMHVRRTAALMMGAALVLVAACGDDDDDDDGAAATTAAAAGSRRDGRGGEHHAGRRGGGDCVVGVSWNNYQEERWAKWDEPALKAAIEAGGGSTSRTTPSRRPRPRRATSRTSSPRAPTSSSSSPRTARPSSRPWPAPSTTGVPVIAYDRLIEDRARAVRHVRQRRVGEMQAQAVFDAVPEGNYVIIKGNSADANADFLRAGYEDGHRRGGDRRRHRDRRRDLHRQLGRRRSRRPTMEQFLTAENNDVDAVLSENDGMAGGVVAALEAQGLAGQIPVSGQDGDLAALNRVALGTQTVDVWKDARELGTTAGEAAVALCANPDVAAVAGTAPFTTPGGNRPHVDPAGAASRSRRTTSTSSSTPAGSTRRTLCQGVEAGSVAACA